LFPEEKVDNAGTAFAHGATIHDREKRLARMLLQRRADWSRRPTRASIANPAAPSVDCLMTNLRPLLPIVALVVLGGAAAHAGEFSLGSTHMLAQAGADAAVDVTVNFTDRGRAQRETAEGGDSAPSHATHNLRGADDASAPDASDRHAATETPAPKASTPAPATTDSPHGVSISPSTAIRRPSYRWQSLVPGTIK
jgi:hypothetical protein